MIPLFLITGFLGTGKTTLLRRIIEENRDRKLAYLINEFSAMDVDGAVVSKENPNVISIPGGSIFCRCLVTQFIGQLTKIQQKPDIEGVVIEASGMADPRVISEMLQETHLDQHFKLTQIISIVEPRSFLRLIHTLPNIIHQVEAANLVLLNKCDLFEENLLQETEDRIRSIRPEAKIQRCVQAKTHLSLFEGEVPELFPQKGEYAKCKDPRYGTFFTPISEKVDLQKIEHLILKHEEVIYRVKGFLQTQEQCILFEYSATGFSKQPALSPNEEELGLVWICHGDALENLKAELQSTLGNF
jgi:G3E family GTPase